MDSIRYFDFFRAFSLLIVLLSCNNQESTMPIVISEAKPLFELLPSSHTKIDFINTIAEGLNTNVLMYEYFYNGGGVAIGDVDGNGYEDVYFTSNMEANKLYLNQGNMVFKEVAEQAGVSGRIGPWTTGVTMVDINADGWLDIYVCNSGNLSAEKKKNQLFLHTGILEEGVPIYKEAAEQFGLASSATSTQASFFDFDRDGDLDVFLLNHNPKSLPVLDEASTADILTRTDAAGSQLFRNDKGYFTDITELAGIQNSALSYGLGVGISDINNDGWLDIYIGNDYTVPDYLYINNQQGGFEDQLHQYLGHTSHFSMGNDIADINNDGLTDIYTLDMLPADHTRQNLLMMPDNYEKYDFNIAMGFHHQYMRNMLHLNNGDQTMSEVGQLAGISNTDWSWAALLADFDADGWKDVYVTNGYLRDYTNLDFLKYMGDYIAHNEGNIQRQNVLELVEKIPSSPLENYFFKNKGGQTFKQLPEYAGIAHISNSNGAAYADLDNDGDLDLIVNNINDPAFILENQVDSISFLKVNLSMDGGNTQAIGAKVTSYSKQGLQVVEIIPVRGFQSSVTSLAYFGFESEDGLDSLVIQWPNGQMQTVQKVSLNQTLNIHFDPSDREFHPQKSISETLFSPEDDLMVFLEDHTTINDFKRQPLLPRAMSFETPCLAKGDVNGDQLEDIFVGGKYGQIGQLFIQQPGGNYKKSEQKAFSEHLMSEDVDAVMIDVDRDGDLDLYVASGGYFQFNARDELLQDRVYLNDGDGQFAYAPSALPAMLTSTGCVAAGDVDGDGDEDLFVGGRVIPGEYPKSPRSYLLVNNGRGNFEDNTMDIQSDLQQTGMVTDAEWLDVDQDGALDLMVVGEWMPIALYLNKDGRLQDHSTQYFAKPYSGWWNTLLIEDINGDGRPDLVVGNQGLNHQIVAREDSPIGMVYKDFDDNGSMDPILTVMIHGKEYPYVTRDELLDQITYMRGRFTSYASYANATLTEVFTAAELDGVKRLEVHCFETMAFVQSADGVFKTWELPIEVQYAPMHSIVSVDLDDDGYKDLLFFGNEGHARLRFGKSDANYGLVLQNIRGKEFKSLTASQTGMSFKGDVRSGLVVKDKIFIGHRNEGILVYRIEDK